MQVPTRVSTTTIHDLLFAYDCALDAVMEEDTQRNMELFATGCLSFGLIINTDKTVVMHYPPLSAECNTPRVNVNGRHRKTVENFAQRISEASQAFGRLQAAV
ncbi:unnamed protein product [Schistocephalus solidus]|uniref:Reverse transcriptase domain-containing protein n=1 Tax=Schistocephalus solidus TaxID=70667 RepID=A0A183TIY6_SCHSO|nr:unnamed protein product [Schistocephalus solidus]